MMVPAFLFRSQPLTQRPYVNDSLHHSSTFLSFFGFQLDSSFLFPTFWFITALLFIIPYPLFLFFFYLSRSLQFFTISLLSLSLTLPVYLSRDLRQPFSSSFLLPFVPFPISLSSNFQPISSTFLYSGLSFPISPITLRRSLHLSSYSAYLLLFVSYCFKPFFFTFLSFQSFFSLSLL